MPPKRPTFRFRATGDVVFAATDRAKEVAALVSRQKSQGTFGPQLSKEQVILRMNHEAISFVWNSLNMRYR